VVVADDDGGAVADDGGTKNLGSPQNGTIDGALVARDILDDTIFGIQDQNTYLLVVEVCNFCHNQAGSVGWRLNLVFLIGLQHTEATAYLQTCFELCRLEMLCYSFHTFRLL